MALDTTTLGELLHEIYSPAAIECIQGYTSALFDAMPVAPETLGGSDTNFAVEALADRNFKFHGENAAFADAGNSTVLKASLSPKVFSGVIQMSGLAKAVSGAQFAFEDGWMSEVDRKLKAMTEYLEGALVRDGTGLLCLVNEPSAVPNTTSGNLNVDTPGTVHLKRNMYVDFHDTSTNEREGTSKITDVDHANNAITLAEDISSFIGDNSKLYIKGAQASGAAAAVEFNGLADQIKTSGTWNGQALATYTQLKGNVISAGSTDLTEDLMQRAQDRTEIEGGVTAGNADKFMFLMHPQQRRKYLDLVRASKQFLGLSLDAGYTGLTYNGAPILVTRDAKPSEVYCGDFGQFQKFYTAKGGLQIDGERGLGWLDGFDVMYMVLKTYMQTAVRNPRAFCRIESLTTPSF